MKPTLSLVVALLLVFVSAFSPPANKNIPTFLEVLNEMQQARDLLKNGKLRAAHKAADRAMEVYPHNRIIFDEAWRIYMICEDHKAAQKITVRYLHHLRDRRGEDGLERDYYYLQYKYQIGQAIAQLNKKNYRYADFNAIRSDLEILQRKNVSLSFLGINDVVEINSLIGVLSFLSKAKAKHFRKDTRHSHIAHKHIQEAYNYFNMADSLNSFFEMGYQDIDSNKTECRYWSESFFLSDLEDEDDLSIPSMANHLGMNKDAEKDFMESSSALRDSILKSYTEPVAYLDCFSDVLSKLSSFKEFHFVFDHSGSMEDPSSEEGPLASMTRHQVMQQAGNYLVLNLVEKGMTNMEAISVGSNCLDKPSINTYANAEEYGKNEEKIFTILDWLEASKPDGATPLYEVFQTLQAGVPATKTKKAILLFSDGVNSCDIDDGFQQDNDRLIDIKQQLKKKNAEIFVMSLVPQEGYAAEYGVYKELAGSSDRIWQFTENCEKVEVSNYTFRLNFYMPPMEGCASHTQRADSVCFDWVDLDNLFDVDFEMGTEESEE